METVLMNLENSKANELHKVAFNLTQRLDSRSLDMLLFKIYYLLHVKKYKKKA